jgi:hypothetical protein
MASVAEAIVETVDDAASRTGDGRGGWESGRLRRVLLALVVLGIVGLVLELVFLEHYDEWTQWIPLALLGAALPLAAVVAARPSRGAIRVFQAMMLAFVAAGIVGLVLHYRGNVEFEVENEPGVRGLQLVWRSLRGATPTLAPGALAQLGLLGLVAAHRHPALRRGAAGRG